MWRGKEGEAVSKDERDSHAPGTESNAGWDAALVPVTMLLLTVVSQCVLGMQAGRGYSRLGSRCTDGHMHFHVCVFNKETRKREDLKP